MVAAAGAGHVPAPAALIFAERSPALAAARTMARLAWPASITVEAGRQLGLTEGSAVVAVIKASDVILVTE